MESTPVNMGKIKRIITNVHLDASDTYAYCSTRTGDILEVCIYIIYIYIYIYIYNIRST